MGTRNNYWKQVTLTCFCPLFDCWILMPCQIGQFCVHLSVNFDARFNRKISISITPSSPEISTGCRKATHKAVQNLGRVITTALTYRFNVFQNPPQKHAAIFEDVFRYNLYYIHDVPTEPLTFEVKFPLTALLRMIDSSSTWSSERQNVGFERTWVCFDFMY